MNGTIIFFNGFKNFGFVGPEDGSPDVFVSGRELAGNVLPEKGDKISFDVREMPDGRRRAVNVRLLESARARTDGERLFESLDQIERELR